jgi:tRNA nucleotidyltransferase (CCA-adding enzyme)
MFVFELEHCCLPPIKRHFGPPLEKELECEKFLLKHLNNSGTVSGPYVEDRRWVVELCRKHVNACDLLRERLKDGGRSAGVAEQISQTLRREFKILVNNEIVYVYSNNKEFAKFLTEFLSGKPKWLEFAQT